MSRVIAGIYEIQKEIGAGGGGIVYLGRHLRLEKQVVLKADRRTLAAKTETLRREVDMLKGLSHTYIPQVYDFVQEDGVVYTVMDFIEGESLDKMLGRNEMPTQPQMIRWACQLLEALIYLHGYPPNGILHGDIKPANIMLRPNGDVCLIDFNIALALGENGAVKIGFSRGYASPEHYGTTGFGNDEDPDKTIKLESAAVMLDARSDIYSLGATLYHLASGRRPAQSALDVEPLESGVCSPGVLAIIQRAMDPDPDMRYQTAEEMLAAFLSLEKHDARVIRHKRKMAVSAVILTTLFLTGGALSLIGLKRLEQTQQALALAEYSSNHLAEGDVEGAVWLALQAIPEGKSFLDAPVTAQAQKALTDALGVYDLSDGFKASAVLELPSAPFDIAVSPKGSLFGAVYAYEAAVFRMEDQEKIAVLPMEKSALADLVFVDESHILYAGEQGLTAYDLRAGKIMWTGETATAIAVSADGSTAAAVNRNQGHAAIYRISDGAKIGECSFGGLSMSVAANDTFADPKDNIFALNRDGTMLAVSFDNGGLTVFDLSRWGNDMTIYEESEYRHFQGGFCGKYFAFAAGKSGKALFGLADTMEQAYLGGYDSQDGILLRADERGIYIAVGNLLVSLDPESLREEELAYTGDRNISAFSVEGGHALIAEEDNRFSFYNSGANLLSTQSCEETCDFVALTQDSAVLANRSGPSMRILKLESHEEAQVCAYDARYDHDEARISRDGGTCMLFSCRGFRIYDREGNLLIQVEMPDPEYIYDQQFIKSPEGSRLLVIWYDGTRRSYSAEDGSMISEDMGEAPAKDLYEEFYTDRYRITSDLHAAPAVYELESGRRVAQLEEDAYLTYVTQAGGYIITEYISAAGERYGILLDGSLHKLAFLPDLCDVAGDKLVFDDGSGNLRQCRLYSLQELVALGKEYIDNTKTEGGSLR